MLHALIPWRGTLHEMHIPQLLPTPVYSDSQSTIFVANSAAAAKLSVWLNRRIKVLREGVDTKEIVLFKISDADNCANYFTKPITTEKMKHYFSYTHATERCIQEQASTMPDDSEFKAVSSGKVKAAAFKAVSNE